MRGVRALALLAALAVLFCGMALRAAPQAEGAVYWSSGTWVGAANLDGSAPLISYPYEIVNVVPRSSTCGIAVDSEYLYWADSRQGTIGRMQLSPAPGGRLEYLADERVAIDEAFVSGLVEPCGVAVDSGHLYWADRGAKTIGRAGRDGSAVQRNFVLAGPWPCGIGVDAGHLYWTDVSAGTIGRARLDGSEVEPEFVAVGGNPCGVAADAAHLYWSDETFGIGRAGIDGSAVEARFIRQPGWPCGVAVDSGHVYWGIRSEVGSLVGRANLDGSGAGVLVAASHYGGGCGVALDSRVFGPDLSARPSEYLRFGRIAHAKRRATVRLAVRVPAEGDLVVTGPPVGWRVEKPAGVAPGEPRTWTLVLWPGKGTSTARRIHRRLRRRGRAQIVLKVAYRQEDRQPLSREKRLFFRRAKRAGRGKEGRRIHRSIGRHGYRAAGD